MLIYTPHLRLSRRTLIAGAGSMLVAGAARAALTATPPQTMGPFYPRQQPPESDIDLTRIDGRAKRASGNVIEVAGRVLDASGGPVRGATVEIWQADAFGVYSHVGAAGADPNFQGYGRVASARDGGYRFRTIKPRHYGQGFVRTPHIHFRIIDGARRLVTQMYFPGEELNRQDGLYRRLGSDAAREAATAERLAGEGPERFGFDIVLG